MAKGKLHTVPYRRKREGKTNYKKRLQLLISRKLRLVIRKSLRNMIVQLVEYHPDGDKVLVSSSTRELIKLGWDRARGNIPTAYLTGYLLGVKAKKSNYGDAIVDFGLQSNVKGSRIYAALKGAIDAGLDVHYGSEDIFPPEERINGVHINDDVAKLFETVKAKIK